MTAAMGVRRVRVPFRVPFETAAGTWTARESLLVELRSDEGARGVGEAPIPSAISTAVLTAHVQALLEGPGAGVPDEIRHAFGAGLGGALLDLAPAPEPVLAAMRAGVGVNATIGGGTVGETIEACEAAVAAGFRTLKLKASAREDAGALADRMRAVRETVGDEVAIRIDANGSWDLDEAIARLRAIEGLGIQYVEQPLPVGARGAAAQLRTKVGVRIAADEAVTSPEAAVALAQQGIADVLVVKPARVGGPGVVAAISTLAAEHGVPVVVSTLFETGVGLAAAIAVAAALPDVPGWPAAERDHGLATSGLLEHDLLATPLVLERGRIRAAFLPGSNGLGIALDEAAVERYAVDDAA
jgi:o-succinylbenzoate synthase